MTEWTLSDIRTKFRQVTGRLSPQELTNSQVDDRINKYYQYTFPSEVKLERQHTFFDFLTSANQATYDFEEVTAPNVFTNVEPPATIDNLSLIYYQDPGRFNEENPFQVNRRTMGVGDGFTTVFTTTITGFPILPASTVVTDDSFLTDNVTPIVVKDTNEIYREDTISMTGVGVSGNVNYSTGVVDVTFINPPENGQNVLLTYIIFQAGRPTAVLFYDNQFKFFVPPNTAYRFRMKGYKVVDALVNATDTPIYSQWGPAIAYGAARDLHSDFGEIEAYGEVTALYNEQIDYVMTRTDQNLLNTRAQPFF